MNPEVPLSVRSDVSGGAAEDVRDGLDLWEQVFSAANLAVALGRVERNRGAAGVDGVSAQELRG